MLVRITSVNISSGGWVPSHPEFWTLIGVISPSEVLPEVFLELFNRTESSLHVRICHVNLSMRNWLFSLVSVSSHSTLVQ